MFSETTSDLAQDNRRFEIAPCARLPLTVAEYFAGIGLVRMGLEREGWRVLFANDWSEQKLQMYEGFFRNVNHYQCSNVFDLDVRSIPEATLATCSFPCIDLSLAGNMNGMSGEHSSAFWGFVRVLQEQGESASPLVLVENVPGWLTSNNGADFRVTIKALNDLGYVCDVFLLNALRFTPQSRNRIFVVGAKCWTGNFDIQVLLSRSPSLSSKGIKNAINANRDLQWMSLHIPQPLPLLQGGLASQVIQELAEEDSRWWSDHEVDRHLAMMSNPHRHRVEVLAQQESYVFRTFFRRRRDNEQRVEVRKDDIAGCLRTANGGSSRQFVLRAGMGQIRMRNMTSREYARLQGVPDCYQIDVDENQALTGFGDAVCVPAISWIARNVLNQLVEEVT